MNFFTRLIIAVYSRSLVLYPRRFRNEFAYEMQVVFRDSINEAIHEGAMSLLFICLKEFGGLPIHVLREFWHEIERKDTTMVTQENVKSMETTSGAERHWDALIGALPFLLFGIASMIGKIRLPFWGIYADLIFYFIVLLGFLIGLVKGVPRWTYSYLGWSLVFAWWWSNMGTYGLKIFGFQINYWTWQIWSPFLLTIGIALLWTRSLHPLRQLVSSIWQDWTLLSLAIYAFVAFASLIYDENHHPYLLAFIAATTIVICLAVWGFLKSDSNWKRVVSLLAGFVTAFVLSNFSYLNNMSYATQDYAASLGLPPSPPQPWYTAFDGIIIWTVIYSGIMYWPALIGLIRHIINNRQKPVMPA